MPCACLAGPDDSHIPDDHLNRQVIGCRRQAREGRDRSLQVCAQWKQIKIP